MQCTTASRCGREAIVREVLCQLLAAHERLFLRARCVRACLTRLRRVVHAWAQLQRTDCCLRTVATCWLALCMRMREGGDKHTATRQAVSGRAAA